jgi:catechol-2,3-dioxygenase
VSAARAAGTAGRCERTDWTTAARRRGARHLRITLETADLDRLERFYREGLGCEVLSRQADRIADMAVDHRGPVEHPGGDRSLYLEDPAGNVIEVWTSSSMARAPVTASAR